MTLEDLKNLSALQMPNIDFGIFTPADDIIASETSRNAISPIGMPDVSLHTTRRVVIPQSNSGVLRGAQDKFGIGRKSSERTGMKARVMSCG